MATADRLIEVFNEAKARPAGADRERFIDEVCRDDNALKEQVISLLKANEGAGDFLQKTPLIFSTPLLTEKPGDRIGRYKLLEQIGEGGCGVVYMAEQQEPVRRRVALKVIKLGMDTKQVIARFEAERQALALMDHPNIAKVLDAGATDTGRPFFVMELVRGIKITDYCDQNNLSTAERLELFIQVCQAIQHAHQKGIIHRDIKPSNILVTQHDDVAVPKVIDFGIAKATTGQLTDKTLFTAFAQFIGTPAYMSPEQAQLSGLDIDTRADIYSLGVLLYELLTGSTPFSAKDLLAAGLDEMRRKIREEEPARPSTCLSTMQVMDLTAVAKQRHAEPPKLIYLIRGDLDWLVMKCLEKDRTRRYETANALAADLQHHLNNEPIVACPPSRSYRFQKLVRRNKLAFAAVAAVTMALVLGIFVSSWQAIRAMDAEKLAKARLVEVSAERDAKEVARQEAEAISTFISEVFQSASPHRDGRTTTVAETLDKAAKNLETDLADQPARRARLQATLGKAYYSLGLRRQAIPLQEKALNYYRTASGPEHPDTLSTAQSLAGSYDYSDRRDEALKLREEGLRLRRKVLGQEHPDTLTAMNNLAVSYATAARRSEALKLREEVATLRRRVLGAEHPDTLWAMHHLATSYHDAARLDEALKLREEVLALRLKLLGVEHPDTLAAMHCLAESHVSGGRGDEALKLREEVATLRRKVLGAEHPDTLWAIHHLAISYDDAGRRDEAIKLREELLPLRRKVSGPDHRDTLLAMQKLADSYRDASRRDEEIKLREEVLALRRKVFGPEHTETLRSMQHLASSYRANGDVAKAESLEKEIAAAKAKAKPAGTQP
jgi:eukaryotic-like serine/threonine-protein kinase